MTGTISPVTAGVSIAALIRTSTGWPARSSVFTKRDDLTSRRTRTSPSPRRASTASAPRAHSATTSAVSDTVVVASGGFRQAQAVLSQGSYYSHNDLRLHFGLGKAEKADEIEVRWPSGEVDTLRDVAARRAITIQEGSTH